MTEVTRFAPSPTGRLHLGGGMHRVEAMLNGRAFALGRFALRCAEDTGRR